MGPKILSACFAITLTLSSVCSGQFIITLGDLKIVEQESGEAKRVRLEFIQSQIDEIKQQRVTFEKELEELNEAIPIVRQSMSEAAQRRLDNDRRNFQQWFSVPNSRNRYSIANGRMLNLAIRILGPVAARRQQQSSPSDAFSSLNGNNQISADQARRLHLVNEMTTGSLAVTRLNAPPLEIEWPLLVLTHWEPDCEAIEGLRDDFADHLLVLSQKRGDNAERRAMQKSFELLDERLELLEAKVHHAQIAIAKNYRSGDEFTEMGVALRYVRRVRATANRFRQAPSEFKERRFAGGNIEEFLIFCYTQSLAIGEATPDDEAEYIRLYNSIRNYAQDIWHLEDLRTEVQFRLQDLSIAESELINMGATDAARDQ
ncbi:MAG: hypothetical protein KDA88_17710 [Planctomycetaceae bacterium]|nr:hypothetical protein [Planctomycetaceae bacterium]MCB9950046.1 hypothetical protein [Planctomycetaceae bacterium]